MNKKAQGLSINTIILIILGVVVLVVMILGFTMGWGNFKVWIAPSNNAQQIITQCSISCSSDSEHDYCNTIKNLNLEDDKSAEGSCKALDNVEGFSSSCDSIKCASVVKPAICKKKGDVVDCESWEKSDVVLLYAAAGEDLGTIDGKPDIEQRKKDLGISDKFCYWQAMADLYKEKCEFKDEEIQAIFDKKKIYREENTPNWAELNDDGDFCVPVIFDYEEYEKQEIGLFAAGLWDGEKIYINPNINWKKGSRGVEYVLIHEGLHSVQKKLDESKSHLGEGNWNKFSLSNEMIDSFEAGKIIKEICPEMEEVIKESTDKYNLLIENMESQIDNLYSHKDDPNGDGKTDTKDVEFIENMTSELFKKQRILRNRISNLELISIKFCGIYTLSGIKDIDNANAVVEYLSKSLDMDENISRKNADFIVRLKKAVYDSYLQRNQVKVKDYLSYKLELDPRLSEVQRWWLDVNDCDIIDTKEKAKEALDRFLIEKDIGAYGQTQSELKILLEVYEKEGREQEVYDALVNRLPGMAMDLDLDTGIIDDGTAYA